MAKPEWNETEAQFENAAIVSLHESLPRSHEAALVVP